MNKLRPQTLRLLGQFWLEEIRPDDMATLAVLPELAGTLPQKEPEALTELAVEYQRLFGFNLPPYESVFVDPSAMLLAPATNRVQTLYRQANWSPPAQVRSGAPDHLGLELLALAAWFETELTDLARRLLVNHLALWAPICIMTLRRLDPQPFYATLGELTLTQLLAVLPAEPLPAAVDPFPPLPQELPLADSQADEEAATVGLRDIVNQLLTPRTAGLFLTRDDIGRLSQALDLPPVMGERQRMLDTLFRQAGQYDLVPALLEQLTQTLAETSGTYEQLAGRYPAWTLYAQAWQQGIATAQAILDEVGNTLARETE